MNKQIIFLAEAHPAWRHQWAERPATALARRGLPARVVTASDDWPAGSIVVALLGQAGKVLHYKARGDRVVAVVPDDMRSLSTARAAEMGLPPAALEAVVTQLTDQVAKATAIVACTEPLIPIVRAINPNVSHVPFVAPPEDEWPMLVPKVDGVLRVGWCGSFGLRELDFGSLKDAFLALRRTRPNLRFTFWGTAPRWAGELAPHVELTAAPAVRWSPQTSAPIGVWPAPARPS